MESLALLLWLCADPVVPTPDQVPDANPPPWRAVMPRDMKIDLLQQQSKYVDHNQNDLCMVCLTSEWFKNRGRRDD